jgi:hypothetical protein
MRAVRRVTDCVLVGCAALCGYLLLAQRTFYGVDGWRLVRRVSTGDVRSDMHLLYKPIAHRCAQIGESLGLSVYESMVVASAVGTAVGVGFLVEAGRQLGLGRGRAVLTALLVGVLPGVLFFATVVERHGPFFAFAGLTAFAAACLSARPSAGRGIGFAVACTLAYAAHSTGVLMVAAFLPFAFVLARRNGGDGARPGLAPFVVAALGTGVGMFAARRLGVRLGTVQNEGDNFAFFLQHAAVHVGQLEQLPGCLWNEVAVAFFPASVLWLLARPRDGLLLLAVAAAIAVYGLLSFLILGSFDERGAYALPLAWPLAAVAGRTLRTAQLLRAIFVAAFVSIVLVLRHDDRHLDSWNEGLRELSGTREPYLIAAAWDDFEYVFLFQPEARAGDGFYDAFDAHGFPADLVRANAALLHAFLADRKASGRELYVSDRGLETLHGPADPGKAGALVVDVLRQGFDFERVDAGGFAGYRLVPKT